MKQYKPEENPQWENHLICFGYQGRHAWAAYESNSKQDHKVECSYCGVTIPNNYITVADKMSETIFNLI